MLATPAGGDVVWTLLGTALVVAVFAPLTMWLCQRQGG